MNEQIADDPNDLPDWVEEIKYRHGIVRRTHSVEGVFNVLLNNAADMLHEVQLTVVVDAAVTPETLAEVSAAMAMIIDALTVATICAKKPTLADLEAGRFVQAGPAGEPITYI